MADVEVPWTGAEEKTSNGTKLNYIDAIVIIIYFLFVLGVGLWVSCVFV